MDDLLIEYADRFGENFPIFIVRNLDQKEIIHMIKTAFETGKPFKVDQQENIVY